MCSILAAVCSQISTAAQHLSRMKMSNFNPINAAGRGKASGALSKCDIIPASTSPSFYVFAPTLVQRLDTCSNPHFCPHCFSVLSPTLPFNENSFALMSYRVLSSLNIQHSKESKTPNIFNDSNLISFIRPANKFSSTYKEHALAVVPLSKKRLSMS